jgi:hypothetical protein
MNLERLEKVQSFIDNLQTVYDEYKKDMVIPTDSNITIMLTQDQVSTLKDLFVDGMQKAIFANEKDHYLKYQSLYENIFFQVAAELFT